ncbi:unnamed protein product [Adineta steineri]|uniref:Uncharacterized protein n=1 Tax=Adineta steineri TaxID=433720 RepID=A0A820JZP0_9BILA|nr:unnamed protein product [Adineta steineri]
MTTTTTPTTATATTTATTTTATITTTATATTVTATTTSTTTTITITTTSATTTFTTTTGADTGETSITTATITTTTTNTPSEILNDIPDKFKNPPYPLYVFQNTTECDNTTGKVRIPMEFEFDNNATILNNLIDTMKNLTERVGVELLIKDLCGRDIEEGKY